MMRKKWLLILLLILLGTLGLGLYYVHWEFRPPVLDIYFFSLNKGRSIFLRTPHNQTILIDGGQNTEIIRALTNVFPFYRRRIDVVILTSSAAKNAGGLAEVIDRYDIGKIIEPAVIGTSTAFSSFEKSAARKNLTTEKVKKGDIFDIDGVSFKIIFPDPEFKFTKTNAPQLAFSLSYGSTSAVLFGDISKVIQKSLILDAEHADIIEYSHGASDSRVSEDLFDAINPLYAVISKQLRAPPAKSAASSAKPGAKPKKPPKKPPFDISKKSGTTIVNLLEKGTAHFISDGQSMIIK